MSMGAFGVGGGNSGLNPMGGSIADLGVIVASYPQYAQAQRAVDYLSDNQFPVDTVSIVGSNLSIVERVLGRLTTAKAALSGLAAGAWFGLFIGLLFGIFTTRNWFAVVFTALAIGAVWGAIFGAIGHAATRGARDFLSRSSLAAGSYEVLVSGPQAERARAMLANLPPESPPPGAMPGAVSPGTMPPTTMPPATPPGTPPAA